MKRRTPNLLIIINCSLACMFLLIAGSLAAYTSLSNAKRTISTVGSKQLFSSNILLEYDKDDDIQSKFMSFSKDTESTFKVSVCNYAQDNPEKYASEDINYTIKVSLLDQNGKKVTDPNVLSRYKWNDISFSDLNDPKYTLSKGQKSEHIYSITVPAGYMKGYKIKIIAESGKNGYRSLGRTISFSEDVASSEWKIDYLNDEQGQEAYDLGCINTRITGSEYAELTLTWDTAHVQIDPWFLEDIKKSTNVYIISNNNSLTFKAGGDSGFNQYDITFYRTNPVHSDDSIPEDWNAIKSYIRLTSEKITESGRKTKK
nr:hypothetical protein [uncultured Blautia sp.]